MPPESSKNATPAKAIIESITPDIPVIDQQHSQRSDNALGDFFQRPSSTKRPRTCRIFRYLDERCTCISNPDNTPNAFETATVQVRPAPSHSRTPTTGTKATSPSDNIECLYPTAYRT
eukprot:GHVU01144543.1.p2 GENE.GHVU01144543.1~~GHVU01144543.1.p2  ORF type:complete len:118 (-),score=4.21 GHVU01144543.1:106-459(-)